MKEKYDEHYWYTTNINHTTIYRNFCKNEINLLTIKVRQQNETPHTALIEIFIDLCRLQINVYLKANPSVLNFKTTSADSTSESDN